MSDANDVLNIIMDQDAAHARGDARAIVAPVSEDVVLFDLPPPLQIVGTTDDGIAGLEEWFDTWENGVSVELQNPTVIVEGDLAVVFGLSRMKGVKKGEGPVDAWNRRTVVLSRRDGQWTIIHEHSSYPMAMDGSGRAMTELRPG